MLSQLEQEHLALQDLHSKDLEQIVREKQQTTEALEQQVRLHGALLSQMGLAQEKDATSRLIATEPSPALSKLWQDIRETAERCQKQNEINGQIIEASRQQTQRAIEVLIPHADNRKPVYGRKGRLHTASGMHIIGKA